MSESMRTLPFETLLDWILEEYESSHSIFGIHESLFYRPDPLDEAFATSLFGRKLSTPIGPAAGPHTQLTQNILSAWLTGGRFIELKTVQIMDSLEIPRPCIDLADEGYNVEWSQELRLHESVGEYVKAWVLVRVLRRLLGMDDTPFGTIFNMSVGYNLEGILSDPMQTFMATLENAETALAEIREVLRDRYPQFSDLEFPQEIVNSVTLSTMHGCPPDEIEKIARYLLEERNLHTTVKLNPTLLGKERLLGILHGDLGFTEIHIPDAVFDHDLKYERALALIRSLQKTAVDRNLTFGVKLSNTLAMANHRGVLPGDEMYMSGRALYPITMTLFDQLSEDLGDDLVVSYSAGADALNVVDVLRAGAVPVTVASDLLKPGGYGRFAQYIDALRHEARSEGHATLADFGKRRRAALSEGAPRARAAFRYSKSYFSGELPKVDSVLGRFDCIEAPCVAQCAVCQDIPDYAHWIAVGQMERALSTILHRNPLPACTGHVCTNLCQTRCTRINYDQPVSIRRLKRFAVEHADVRALAAPASGHKVAIIGSGPVGLAAAYYLALSGVAVTIFEAKDRAGGMLAIAPQFRLPPAAVESDLDRIRTLGVDIRCNHPVTVPPEQLLKEGYDAVLVACGFSQDASLDIEGIDVDGVYGALEVLNGHAFGNELRLGENVVVIGGGNTAMDAARTAQRLTGNPSTVAYRRSRAEMPAEHEEIDDLLAEGNRLETLTIPYRVVSEQGHVIALECLKAKLGMPDESGRRRPEPIEGSVFKIPADTIILAVGQRTDGAFLETSTLEIRSKDGGIDVEPQTGATSVEGVYAGGDIARGPAIIIAACADGRNASAALCERFGIPFRSPDLYETADPDLPVQAIKAARVRKCEPQAPIFLPVEERTGFDLIERTLSKEQAVEEAKRCLQCQLVCDKCVDVCPNRANIPFEIEPIDVTLPLLHPAGEDRFEEVGKERIQIIQSRQILHLDELCNECGNCATFCVHEGKPYQDKPRLFLDRSGYEAESDNAFYFRDGKLLQRDAGVETSLAREGDDWIYETPVALVRFSGTLDLISATPKVSSSEDLSLRQAVEMACLANALMSGTIALPMWREET